MKLSEISFASRPTAEKRLEQADQQLVSFTPPLPGANSLALPGALGLLGLCWDALGTASALKSLKQRLVLHGLSLLPSQTETPARFQPVRFCAASLLIYNNMD